MEYSLDSVSASAGDDILIARSVEAMQAYFADCFSEFEIVMIANSEISQKSLKDLFAPYPLFHE